MIEPPPMRGRALVSVIVNSAEIVSPMKNGLTNFHSLISRKAKHRAFQKSRPHDQACCNGQSQKSMRDALTKLGLAGKCRIGVDLIEIACQPCKIENIPFADCPPNRRQPFVQQKIPQNKVQPF